MYDIIKVLQFEEGKKLKAYVCSEGYLTVGIGHNLDSDKALSILDRVLSKGDVITEDECKKLFQQDIIRVKANIAQHLPYFPTLATKYQLLLINMVFQLGISGTLAFKNTLQAVKEDRPLQVEQGIQRSKWFRQTPNRCARLIKLVKDEEVKEWL
jgi:GH24 family phage-related lysozyme (muramidase)